MRNWLTGYGVLKLLDELTGREVRKHGSTGSNRRCLLTADYTTKPYAHWVEDVMREMFDIDPTAIALEMRDAKGQTYTCYWDCSRDDRACMIGAMQDDDLLDFIAVNKDVVAEILNGEEDDEDGLCEPDTETDSTG